MVTMRVRLPDYQERDPRGEIKDRYQQFVRGQVLVGSSADRLFVEIEQPGLNPADQIPQSQYSNCSDGIYHCIDNHAPEEKIPYLFNVHCSLYTRSVKKPNSRQVVLQRSYCGRIVPPYPISSPGRFQRFSAHDSPVRPMFSNDSMLLIKARSK